MDAGAVEELIEVLIHQYINIGIDNTLPIVASHVPSWNSFSFCCYPPGFSIMGQALATTTTIPLLQTSQWERFKFKNKKGKTLLFEVQYLKKGEGVQGSEYK